MRTEQVWVADDGEFMRMEFVLSTFSKAQYGGLFLPDRIVRPKLPRLNGVQWVALMDPNKEVSDYPEVSEVEHIVYHRREFRHLEQYASNRLLRDCLRAENYERPRRYPEVQVREWDIRRLAQWSPGIADGNPPGWRPLVTNGDQSDLQEYVENRGWRIRAPFSALVASALDFHDHVEWPTPPEIWVLAVENRHKEGVVISR